MALSRKDCLAIQAFAEHTSVCRDLISSIAGAKLQFVGKARSLEVVCCGTAFNGAKTRIAAATPAPSTAHAGDLCVLCTDGSLRAVSLDDSRVHDALPAPSPPWAQASSRAILHPFDSRALLSSCGGTAELFAVCPSGWTRTAICESDDPDDTIMCLSTIPHKDQFFRGTRVSGSLVDAETGACIQRLRAHACHAATPVLDNPNYLVVAGVWSNGCGTGAIIDVRQKDTEVSGIGVNDATTSRPFSRIVSLPHGKLATMTQNMVRIWDARMDLWDCTHFFRTPKLKEQGKYVDMCQADAAGKLIATVMGGAAQYPPRLHLWNLAGDWLKWTDRTDCGEAVNPTKVFPLTPSPSILNTHTGPGGDAGERAPDTELSVASLTCLPDSRLAVCTNTSSLGVVSVYV